MYHIKGGVWITRALAIATLALTSHFSYADKSTAVDTYQKPGAPVRIAPTSRHHVIMPGVETPLTIALDSSANPGDLASIDVSIHTTEGLALLSESELSGMSEVMSAFTVNVYAETTGQFYVYLTVTQHFSDGSQMSRALGASVTAVAATADKTAVQKTKQSALKKTGEIRDVNGQRVSEMPAQETIR